MVDRDAEELLPAAWKQRPGFTELPHATVGILAGSAERYAIYACFPVEIGRVYH